MCNGLGGYRTTSYNSWNPQQLKNMLELLEPTSDEMAERSRVLRVITRVLNEAGIVWTLSCSSALFMFGIVQGYGDYDILVREEDFDKLKATLAAAGVEMLPTTQKKEFASPFYQQARMGKVEFDLIARFWISMPPNVYCYDLKEEDIVYFEPEDDFKIPALAVEVQMVLYGYMIGWQAPRRIKMLLCKQYLKENGVKRKSYLQGFLDELHAPDALKEAIRELLSAK